MPCLTPVGGCVPLSGRICWMSASGSPSVVRAGWRHHAAAAQGVVLMTVTADRRGTRRSSARPSGRGPARAAPVEHLSRADRMARGKDARAVAPLESHSEFRPGQGRDPGRAAAGQASTLRDDLWPPAHGPDGHAGDSRAPGQVGLEGPCVSPGWRQERGVWGARARLPGDSPSGGGDDAVGDAAGQAERGAHGEHDVTDPGLPGRRDALA